MTTSLSQSPGPGDRPVSDILDSPATRSPPPLPPPRKEFKAYGQDYQYAETWSNPLPEFIVHNPCIKSDHPGALEAGVTGGTRLTTGAGPRPESIDGTQDTSISMDYHERASQNRPDTVGSKGSVTREAIRAPPYEKPWYRKLTHLQWLIGTVTFLGVLAVVLAILGATGILTGTAGTELSLDAANSTISGIPTSASTTSSSSGRPVPTNIDNFCKDSSSFLTNVDMYNAKANGDLTKIDVWYDSANSAEGCCNSCFHAPDCAGWMYTGADFTPCTLYTLKGDKFAESENKDQCPSGQADMITFTHKNGDFVAARGPCSTDFKFER